LEPVPLRGEHVVLEPLDLAHAEPLHAALDDEEVWRWADSPRPASAAEVAELIRAALRDAWRGVRVPWVQRCAATGAVVGTISYHHPDPTLRTLRIGGTRLGRRWWHTAIETESELLLLGRAFDELGAIRVTWQTNARDERSRRAVEGLGATLEGTLRADRRHADGSWQDSALYSMIADEWPNAQLRLRERLCRTAPTTG
jgi:RimJ/RimL family protein N-acetyltransferase